jgi:hypothetical protein
MGALWKASFGQLRLERISCASVLMPTAGLVSSRKHKPNAQENSTNQLSYQPTK